MKPSPHRLSLQIIVVLLFVLIISACKKDPYEVGVDLLPATDTLNLQQSDTASLIAYSELQDSIRTDKTSTFLLGSILDPVFGISTASFYSQFRFVKESYDFGENPVLDSVVLALQYYGIYGDSNTYQTVRVYEVSQILDAEKSYYSNQSAGIYPVMLASKTFRPAIHDSVRVYTKKTVPHLRINLNQYSNYFGNKIISTPASILADNNNFVEYMRGLYIESAPTSYSGALIQFKPVSAYSKIIVYYHNTSVGDSLSCELVITTASARFNHIDHHQYLDANPDFKQQVLNHDTTLGKTRLYLQGLGGVRIKVRLPFLSDFSKKGAIAVNNALLVLKNITADTSLAPPPGLTLMQIDSTGNYSFLIDENEGPEYFGGTYNRTARTYSFRITRHVQQILLGKTKNKDLLITVNNPIKSLLDPNRIVINGTQPVLPSIPADRLQFQMIYTRSK